LKVCGVHLMRVFLGLSDICGYYSQLERGLRARGIDTVFVNAFPGIAYGRTTSPDRMGRLVEWLGRKRAGTPRGTLRRSLWIVLQAAALALYGALTLPRFDVYILASGNGFLLGHERRVLRLLGKRVISVCHGSDTRPPYMSGAIAGSDLPLDPKKLLALTNATKAFVRRLESSSDFVINHPCIGLFHERPFINWMSIGIPAAPLAQLNQPKVSKSGHPEIVILHAPTRPGPKGTVQFEEAIERLRIQGHHIRFDKIIGRPNAEVIEAIAACDFVVDELYGDTPMAGLATEAAFGGKPSIVGMRDFEGLAALTPPDDLPPSFICDPDCAESAIRTLITDTNLRLRLGAAAREFVMTRWSAVAVADRFVRLIKGDVPAEWWVDPRAISYFHGWGLPSSRLQEVVREMTAFGGTQALALTDKPVLTSRLLEFCRIS
jgi:hypothetical protein